MVKVYGESSEICENISRSHSFDSALLEYGSLHKLGAPTQIPIYYDPPHIGTTTTQMLISGNPIWFLLLLLLVEVVLSAKQASLVEGVGLRVLESGFRRFYYLYCHYNCILLALGIKGPSLSLNTLNPQIPNPKP